MNDIYQPPAAEVTTSIPTTADFKLYKISGVGLATVLGSPIAGGILMSQNFRRLGNQAAANKTLVLSILGTIAVFVIAYFIPENIDVPGAALTVPQLIIMIMLTKQFQESDIKQHQEAGGIMASNWKAFGIAILVVLGLIALATPFVYF
ncbi:MAG: hypothetical protein COB51_13395 [Moraxellaceae bacterium]|nr:MAG: hypothetical protein COB51_13395 [Moraxellaceae bacterium]